LVKEVRLIKKDGVTEAEGQATKALSIPVVLASDQDTLPVDTELPAAEALGDALANPTSPLAGACLLAWDATASKWRRVQVLTGTGDLRLDLRSILGTALTARDWSGDFALLQPASSIGTLADVTAAAAATQLVVASTPCKAVVVRSLAANTGNIRVGDSSVTASRGAELSAGDAVVIVIDNVNKVYIFGNGTDKVSIMYVN
jgi:hypothetical protein